MRARKNKRLIARLKQIIKSVNKKIIAANRLKTGHLGRANLRLLCIRYDFSDHPALHQQILTQIQDISLSDATPLTTPLTLDEDNDTDSVNEAVDWIRENLFKVHHEAETHKERHTSLSALASKAEKVGIGHCGELTAACFHCLTTSAYQSGIDLIEYLNLDFHALLVINRAPESRLDDPDSWGSDAIIVDAWTNECFLISEALAQDAPYGALIDIQISETFERYTYFKPTPSKKRPNLWGKRSQPAAEPNTKKPKKPPGPKRSPQ